MEKNLEKRNIGMLVGAHLHKCIGFYVECPDVCVKLSEYFFTFFRMGCLETDSLFLKGALTVNRLKNTCLLHPLFSQAAMGHPPL